MIVKSDIYLHLFEFWGGAVCRADLLSDEEMEAVGEQLQELYPDGLTDTQINDMFWFDFSWVCDLIGLTYDKDSGEVIR